MGYGYGNSNYTLYLSPIPKEVLAENGLEGSKISASIIFAPDKMFTVVY
jgi:hypothetical protein